MSTGAASAANGATFRKLVVVTCVMFGFGFAMVPFYKKLCELTGLTNLATADEVAKNTQVDSTRTITMQFDTNLRNDSDRTLTGQAIPSWGPQVAGRHLRKLDCFCFTQQTLKPGEVRRMPVVFVVETTLPEDVNYVTMSYTFFQVEGREGKPG